MIPTDSQSRAWMSAWRDLRDSAAARALVEGMYPLVFGLARRHVMDAGAVEDIVQQTFVRCFAKADQWNPDKPLEPWLVRIVLNLCRDYFRSRQRNKELCWTDLSQGEQAAFTSTAHSSPTDAESRFEESRALLFRLLDTLSADDRLVLSLLHLESRTTDQIAELTGWSRTLVKVRAYRARKKLRHAFEKLEQSRS